VRDGHFEVTEVVELRERGGAGGVQSEHNRESQEQKKGRKRHEERKRHKERTRAAQEVRDAGREVKKI